MKGKSYQNIKLLIVLTAMVLIGAQVYFTMQNFRVNEQRFINDVQIALDLSVEKYFSDQAISNIRIFTLDLPEHDTTFQNRQIKASVSAITRIDTLNLELDTPANGFSYQWARVATHDSIWVDSVLEGRNKTTFKKIALMEDQQELTMNLQKLTDKVMLSFSEELLDIGKLYEAVEEELERKNLFINFVLRQESDGRKTKIGELNGSYLSTSSKSSYLGSDRIIQMDFENATLSILKRGISDLIISILLVGLVIGTMMYLFHTINQQKQLADIKDDLISNITHEFKTPIATIFSALEGVTNFNESNDPVKTRKYLSISTGQLNKLNSMVEKLLETATIDKGKLSLNWEDVELVGWTREVVDRFVVLDNGKSIALDFQVDSYVRSIDVFHLENALANLIDNAIKYGGDKITVRMIKHSHKIIWEVEDNGEGIPKQAQNHIFDKLYRVPKGNTHDVKGFGIGLYYARTIAELHHGELSLQTEPNKTQFRLSI